MARHIECPVCRKTTDLSDEPDYLRQLPPNNRFTYECDCGASFDVDIDWEPDFYVHKSTLKVPT